MLNVYVNVGFTWKIGQLPRSHFRSGHSSLHSVSSTIGCLGCSDVS